MSLHPMLFDQNARNPQFHAKINVLNKDLISTAHAYFCGPNETARFKKLLTVVEISKIPFI
jgi:hypothetical protein